MEVHRLDEDEWEEGSNDVANLTCETSFRETAWDVRQATSARIMCSELSLAQWPSTCKHVR